MAYTPELSEKHCRILRRIAWALGIPMTKTMERIFEHISPVLDRNKICQACRDESFCIECPFTE
jgi:hypothetical protein